MDKKIKIEFAPGAFDHFDGTQEELDEFMKEITRMAESGELEEKSRPLDLDDLSEEEMEILSKAFENEINPEKRKLQ
jgi:hypothetical protein